MTAETLHAPTLRRVIEMLDGEIVHAERRRAEREASGSGYLAGCWDIRAATLRAFRERLEGEHAATETPQ